MAVVGNLIGLVVDRVRQKSSPLMVFANFSAVVPEFKVKFGTLVSSSNLHLTAKYHLISF